MIKGKTLDQYPDMSTIPQNSAVQYGPQNISKGTKKESVAQMKVV